MNSDNYEFAKSCRAQGVDLETPYETKNWGFIQDINAGSYSNNGLSLVQFDLSSIYNSSNLIDPSSMFLTIPITYVSAFVANSALIPAVGTGNGVVSGGWATTGLKSGYFQLIHGADFSLNGKTINQFQPNLNAYVGFKMLSQMSQDDLKTYGSTLGMGDTIDNWESAIYNGSGVASSSAGAFPSATPVGCIGGNGMTNNAPFSLGTPNFGDQATAGAQFSGAYNNGYFSRIKKIIDTTSATPANGLFGSSAGTSANCITNITNMVKEFKPYYTINNTNYATWYDVAIIRLSDIFDSVKQLPLCKRLDCLTRFYINTGTIVSNVVSSVNGVSTGLMLTSSAGITFTNTCPLIQSSLTKLPATSANPLTAIASGLFISTPTSTSLSAGGANGINLASGTQAHFMNACRIYYAQVKLKPERLIPYITENRAKKVVFTDFLTNTFNNISAGATSSFLVQSGVSNIRGMLILPILSGSTNGNAGATASVVPFNQMLSPFDTAPMTTAPISLLNLSVSIGGLNVLQNVLQYGYENFIEQVGLYEKVAPGDLGLSCGLINQAYWENIFRAYYVDCSRATIADGMTPRNVNISFTNNSLQTIDVLVFTEYFKEMVVDVETGLVNI